MFLKEGGRPPRETLAAEVNNTGERVTSLHIPFVEEDVLRGKYLPRPRPWLLLLPLTPPPPKRPSSGRCLLARQCQAHDLSSGPEANCSQAKCKTRHFILF